MKKTHCPKTGPVRLVLTLALLAGGLLAQHRTMGLMLHDSAVSDGYTLFAPMPYTVAYLIDNDGMLINSWSDARVPGTSVYLEESGLLLRTSDLGGLNWPSGGRGGRVELVNWEGEVTWTFDYSNPAHCQHHDVRSLPNGNILMIAWERKSSAEAIAAGRKPYLAPTFLWPDHVIEVNPATSAIVWEWHAWDHLIQDFDPTKPNFGDPRAHPELIDINYLGTSGTPRNDWLHTNSIAYNSELDQILLSVHEFSEVWVIDHSTTTEEARTHSGGRYGRGGDLLYRWGNPLACRRGTQSDQKLFGMHDAQWIPAGLSGAGRILVFNNGLGRENQPPGFPYSSVDEFVLPMDSAGFYHLAPDSAFGPEGPVWRYCAPNLSEFYAAIISGCQRMPNGNTLICDGPAGDFFEVLADGRKVWEYINPVSRFGPMQQGESIPPGANSVFKIRRYPPDYPAFAGRNMTPRGPIEIYPQAVAEQEPAPAEGLRLRVGPNPTARTAQVVLSLAAAAPVQLDIFNPAGQRVAGLANGQLAAGRHEFTWTCSRAPAGTYLAVCRTAAGTQATLLTVTR